MCDIHRPINFLCLMYAWSLNLAYDLALFHRPPGLIRAALKSEIYHICGQSLCCVVAMTVYGE